MITSDRDRVLIALLLAVAIHALGAVLITVFGVSFEPYPETVPVVVTLPQYDDPPPDPEPVDPEPQPQPEPVEPEPAEPEPVPTPSAPEPRSPERPATPAQPAPSSSEPLPWQQDGGSEQRDASRTSDDELFGFDEPDESSSELPSWVVEGQVSTQPEESLSSADQATLEAKRDALEGFDERLNALVDALDNPEGPASAPAPPTTGTATRSDLPGDGIIEWIGSGRREALSTALPQLNASDFGGQVPARVNYIVVFEVNAAGMVIPESLILRQSSGYTLADQKVRAAVLRWRFEPVGGAAAVTAIATLQITRDEIR